MKSQILLSLDHEIIYKLRQQGNMSGYVNNLLSQNLDGGNTKELVQKAIDGQESTIEKANKELTKLKEKLTKIPKYVMREE